MILFRECTVPGMLASICKVSCKFTYAEGSSRQDPDPDSDSNLRPDLDSGFESLKKRIFDMFTLY